MSDDSEQQEIQRTLMRLARPKVSPKELLKEAREAHPKASKKAIVRAAFASLITLSEQDGDKALALQDFALKSRSPTNGED